MASCSKFLLAKVLFLLANGQQTTVSVKPIMELHLLKQVGWKKWGSLDALHAHKGYRMLQSLLNLNVRMLESIGLLFAKDKRQWTMLLNYKFQLHGRLLQTSVMFLACKNSIWFWEKLTETVNFFWNFKVELFSFCVLASRAATLLFISFQITLQYILGDSENSVH